MESSRKPSVRVQEDKQKSQQDQRDKVVEWEDYEQELARLCSLTSALEEAKRKKSVLEEKLHTFIQGLQVLMQMFSETSKAGMNLKNRQTPFSINDLAKHATPSRRGKFFSIFNYAEAESLNRSNELDQMREKLESRKLVMGNMSMQSKVVKEKVRKQEDRLGTEIRSLLVGGTSLSSASKRMQDSSRSLAGEKGYGHLKNLQKLLRERQRHMVSQVSFLYPVKVVDGKVPELELESFSSTVKSGVPAGSKPVDQGTLTISGLHLTVIPLTKLSFFSDKKEFQRSSTALGYVAHAVSLIAHYLQVPLRYPLRLGGSRTYIRDYAPSVEHSASSSSLDSITSISSKPVEFPLFIEGQDSTRAAYAVFLLNKDLEQLLNFIGAKSLGPRHVLANLKELLRIILSPEYLDS